MSCNYAEGLSPYEDKGILGVPEKFDDDKAIEEKVLLLSQWVNESQHVVMHTGAGISTSAGIPDFRGPNGVWTLESKGEKPTINISFDEAIPTKTHMALTELAKSGVIKYIVSQNIDGLHLRSGLDREFIGELHGNMFVDQCSTCHRQFVRQSATTSVGQKCLEIPCLGVSGSGRACRGKLHDTVLDWEANLPDSDLYQSEYHSTLADLNICFGTTLQIVPSGNLPLKSKKYGGRVAIINLQPTKHDRKADLIINAYVDVVISKLMKHLGLEIPDYDKSKDPTKIQGVGKDRLVFEWTISKKQINDLRKQYDIRCKQNGKKRKKKQVSAIESKPVKSNKVKKEESGDEDSELSNKIKAKRIEAELKLECLNEMKTEFNKNDGLDDIPDLNGEIIKVEKNS